MSVIVMVQGNPRPEGKDQLTQYQQAAVQVITKHGGQVIARGGGVGSLHGSKWQVGVVLRFPDKAAVDAWYNDPDYRKVLPLRDQGMAELEINVFQE
jgi:uncharacterized protein (DUF1330 family)